MSKEFGAGATIGYLNNVDGMVRVDFANGETARTTTEKLPEGISVGDSVYCIFVAEPIEGEPYGDKDYTIEVVELWAFA